MFTDDLVDAEGNIMANRFTNLLGETSEEMGCIHLRDPKECLDCARRRSIRLYKTTVWVSALCGVVLGVLMIITW